MRKFVARSIVVALGVLLVCGCSSTGGKSPSVASLNPMKYFAKSKPVPKPSQMTPNVSLPSADGLALTDSKSDGGFAPPSPYGAGAADSKQPKDAFAGQYSSTTDPSRNASPATGASLAASPQHGMYDPNGYAGTTAPSGYTLPKSNSLTGTTPSDSTSPYSLGGSRYDIQNPGLSTGALAGGSSTHSGAGRSLTGGQQADPYYASSGSAYNQPASYQASSLPSPAGAITGASQGAYPSTGTYQVDPSAVYGSWNNGTNPSAPGGYTGSAFPATTDRRDMGGIASLPSSPAASLPELSAGSHRLPAAECARVYTADRVYPAELQSGNRSHCAARLLARDHFPVPLVHGPAGHDERRPALLGQPGDVSVDDLRLIERILLILAAGCVEPQTTLAPHGFPCGVFLRRVRRIGRETSLDGARVNLASRCWCHETMQFSA